MVVIEFENFEKFKNPVKPIPICTVAGKYIYENEFNLIEKNKGNFVETIKKCLNEWNATIEALGHGKQTILIRKYGTTIDKFILFPTVSYALNDNYLDSFSKENKTFAKDNALPKKANNKTEIKYCAFVDKCY